MKCEIFGHVQNTEAVVQRRSVKNVFLEISQNSQEKHSCQSHKVAAGLQLYLFNPLFTVDFSIAIYN